LKSPREIRLYPNRRLYDPVLARYIKYEDVFALVRDGTVLEVKDSKRGSDRTEKVLVDIIIRKELSQPDREKQIFTAEFLRELIRIAGAEKAPLAAAFLDHSVNMLARLLADQERVGTEITKGGVTRIKQK